MMANCERAAMALWAAILCLGFGPSASAKATFVIIDAPGAGTQKGQGTFVTFHPINSAGDVTGYAYDQSGDGPGFIRTSDGTITTFEAPSGGSHIIPQGINNSGLVTGYYVSHGLHGFLREADGTITSFDPKGAGGDIGTEPSSINSKGEVTGDFTDSNDVFHGFTRTSTGKIVEFDAPDAGSAPFSFDGTFPSSINSKNSVVGYYLDSSSVVHGFSRISGSITEFDPPGSTNTYPFSINTQNLVCGTYADQAGAYHGFLRTSEGGVTSFDVSGAGTDKNEGTEPVGLNVKGNIAGYFIDAEKVSHGFFRSASGTVTEFDAPNAGRKHGQGTFVADINDGNEIVGYYLDKHSVGHVFIRIP